MVKLFKGDKGIYAALIILVLLSFIGVLSSYNKTIGIANLMIEQILFVGIGLIIVFVLEKFNYAGKSFKILMLIGCCFSIVSVLLLFTPLGIKAAGTVRDLRLLGFRIQPFEFLKVFTLIYLAIILNEKEKVINSSLKYFVIYICVPIAFVGTVSLVLQGLSSTLIMMAVAFLLLLVSPLKRKYILLMILAVIMVFVAYIIIKKGDSRSSTWQNRIKDWVSVDFTLEDPVNAIGRGGFFGTFFGTGKLKEFLVNSDSDYIFSVFTEEGGILLASFIIFIYVILLMRIMKIIFITDDLFGKYLVFGLGLLIVVQAFSHILYCIGILPQTGQQLPFVSKGGSSLMSMCVAVGIIQSVSKKWLKEEKRY